MTELRGMNEHMAIAVQAKLDEWAASPEYQCNHCKLIFKGSHECDYDQLKVDINRFRTAMQDILNALAHDNDPDFAEEIAVRVLKGETYE